MIFYKRNKSNRTLGVLAFLVVFFVPHTLFADVFAPASCESLYSTDLVTEMSHEIDYRIEGLTANDSTKKVFSTRGNMTDPWARSATVWTTEGDSPLDLTGASPWNSNLDFRQAGVLISPRHIVFAKHYPIANGSTVIFITDDNTIVTRTLQAQMSVVFQPELPDDVQLGVLDSDVPPGIAFYPVISKELMDQYLGERRFPFFIFDQEAKAIVGEVDYVIDSYYEHAALNHFIPNATSTRFSFFEELVEGDSGQPGFFLIHGQPILALTTTTGGRGPFYGAYVEAINDAIITLGNDGGYQLSTYDLSCFVGNEVPEVIDETFMLTENSAEGVVVGTTTASDSFGGDTLTYEIISGNTNNAFAIDANTGVLTVDTESAIDFETHPIFELTIGVSDNWVTPAQGVGRITVELTDVLEVGAPTVLTVPASSITGTSGFMNGSITATGGQNPTLRGFKYGTSVVYGATTTEAGNFSTGVFSAELEALECGTAYHFKAWASNPLGGTAYGSHRTLTTLACEEDNGGGRGGGGGSSGRATNTTKAVAQDGTTVREALIIKLQELIRQFIALGGTPSLSMVAFITPTSTSTTFARDLDVGDTGIDVKALQGFLIAQQKGPVSVVLAKAKANGYFGLLTQSALAEFQMFVGIVPASGYFGPKTRSIINGLI